MRPSMMGPVVPSMIAATSSPDTVLCASIASREREHEDAVLVEELGNLVEELLEPRLDARRPNSVSSHMAVGAGLDACCALDSRLRDPVRPSVWPIAWKPSISIAIVVAERRSPPTPMELSPSKNIRSPASDARETMMSMSRSDFHSLKRSSIGIGDTKPPMSPRRSIVATSIMTVRARQRSTATA